MNDHRILIIGAVRDISLPSKTDIEALFTTVRVQYITDLRKFIDNVESAAYSLLVICDPSMDPGRKKINAAINYLKNKPAVITIANDCAKNNSIPRSSDNIEINIKPDDNLKDNLLCAIGVAIKIYELNKKVESLTEQLERSRTDRNVVELTLSYNHEINNLLTTIIGNTQLMLSQSANLDDNIVKKLGKISKDAQKIQEMAISLINIINAPAESVPLSDI
jgi:hypothetical protein